MTLLEIAESLRVAQSALNAAEEAPALAGSWVTYNVERGAWGHCHEAMRQILAEMKRLGQTKHEPERILDGVYDGGETIAYNIGWLDKNEPHGICQNPYCADVICCEDHAKLGVCEWHGPDSMAHED